MLVRADRVSLDGPHGPLLPPTSLTVASGQLVVLHGEPGTGLTAFGLTLAGRLHPTTGTVLTDSKADDALRRRVTAVVDAPGVSEPDGALPLRVVVGEELSLAGQPAAKHDVANWLAANDVSPYAGKRFEYLEPTLRTRLLSKLAAARKGVQVLVLDTPDRHTSDVDSWSLLAHEHAERGLAVIVLAATTPLSALPFAPARVGAQEQPEPQQCAEIPAEPDVEETVEEAGDTIVEGEEQ